MFVLLLLILWPIAELFVIVKVADAIGILLTILLLFAGWPIGMWLARRQGRAALRRFSIAVNEGRPPGREVIDGALALIGSMLLVVPGFISDVVGLLLLAPPTRSVARWTIVHNFRSRVIVSAARFGGAGRQTYDADSTAVDIDRPQLPV